MTLVTGKAKALVHPLDVYKVLLKLETGELLELARKDRLHEAKQLVESFNEYWPRDYSIQDSESGRDIDFDE